MSDTEKAAQHYADQLKALMFAEVVAALRELTDASDRAYGEATEESIAAFRRQARAILLARVALAKIDQNELLK